MMMVCGSIFNILMDFDVRFELHVLAANQHHSPVAFLGIAQYLLDCVISTQGTFVVNPKPKKGGYGDRKEYAFKEQATRQGS